MKAINKLISIGSNCIGTDIIHFAGLRVPSPVDNFSGFNIWKSHLLFNKKIKKALFKEDYEIRPATKMEKEKYAYFPKVFTFNHNFAIVHNDFHNVKFQKALKNRIQLFYDYYQLSLNENSLWYIYSLEENDKYIDDNFMYEIMRSLPDCCKNRLICIGMRGKNSLFEKYFKYYLEFDEAKYTWHNIIQSQNIIKQYELAFNLKFDMRIK